MPLDRSFDLTERLFLLTNSASEAVANDSWIELDQIIESRQAIIDELRTIRLSPKAKQFFEANRRSDADFLRHVETRQKAIVEELIKRFQDKRGRKVYRNASKSGVGFERVG